MYHGRDNNDHGYANYQQSGWQTTAADDDYYRDTFQPRAHQDHTKYPAYGGWQTSPNEDYYQVVRTETVKTVEPPMFPPQLNTLIDETVRVEGNNSFLRPDKHVPMAYEQVYSTIHRPDKLVPLAQEQVYTSIQHVPQAHEQVYTSIQHVPKAHEQVYTSVRREQHVPMANEQVYTSIRHPEQHVPKAKEQVYTSVLREQHVPMANEQVYTSIRRPEQHVPKAKEVHVKKHVHFVQGGKEGKQETTYDENVDMEADDFIKRKHKKFDLSKLLSMKAH